MRKIYLVFIMFIYQESINSYLCFNVLAIANHYQLKEIRLLCNWWISGILKIQNSDYTVAREFCESEPPTEVCKMQFTEMCDFCICKADILLSRACVCACVCVRGGGGGCKQISSSKTSASY